MGLNRYLHGLKIASLGFAALAILGLLNRSNPGYLNIEPHPFFLAAIGLGAALGLRGALVVGTLIANAYLYFLWLGTDFQVVETIFTLEKMLLPLCMISVPALLGAMTDTYRLRLRETLSTQEDDKRLLADLERINDMITKEKMAIENKVTSQVQTVTQVFEYAQLLETNDPKEITRNLVSIVCDQLGEDNCYAYLVESDGLRLSAFQDIGPSSIPEFIPNEDLEKYPLMLHSIRRKNMTTLEDLQKSGEALGTEHGVCAPMTTQWEQVIGVLYIRRLHFLNYLPTTFTIFSTVARWGGNCLGRALRLSAARAQTYRDDVTGLFSYPYFEKRVHAEFKQARDYNLPLHLVKIRLPGLELVPSNKRLPLLKIVADALARPARQTDTMTLGPDAGSIYVIMFLADEKEVLEYARKAAEQFEELKRSLAYAAPVQIEIFRKLRQDETATDAWLEKEWVPVVEARRPQTNELEQVEAA